MGNKWHSRCPRTPLTLASQFMLEVKRLQQGKASYACQSLLCATSDNVRVSCAVTLLSHISCVQCFTLLCWTLVHCGRACKTVEHWQVSGTTQGGCFTAF
jgi:hypothetical protein